MSDSLHKMELRVGTLERALPPAIARRVRAAAAATAAPAGDAAAAMLRQDAASVAGTMSLAGRTLLVLAGAYLLRALTDTGRVPTWLGVAMGFVYAGLWIAACDRAAGKRLLASAGFHGAAAVVIGFPLLFEATARFKLLPTWFAAILLSGFTAVALAVAARRRFQPLAWLVVLGAIPAAYALMFAQGRVAPPLVFLIVLGTVTVWLGYVVDWHGLRWPVAAAVDLAVLFLAVEAVRPGAPDGPITAIVVQFCLIAAYLGSTAVRTLGLRRSVVAFETVQTAAVLLTALGGAAFVTARAGMGATALGALSLTFGAAAYGVAFSFVERERTPANFYFYTTAGLAFVLAGAGFLLDPAPRGLFWAGLALGAACAARKAERLTLATHAAAYALAAAISGGLLAHAAEAAFDSPAVPWTPATAAHVVIAAAVAFSAWALGSAPARRWHERGPRVVLLFLLAFAAAGLVIGGIAPHAAGVPGAGADPAIVAMIRSVVLALGALALAAMGRTATWADARWLAWPVLGIGGIEMALQMIYYQSRASTLFLALGVYGAALILVPRLRRRAARAGAVPAGDAAGAHRPAGT
ncbi:MAG TPA: hypothetical protein VFL83_18140 [Anaeromyxobacter sp.]|nr:hypothetical protein [Anaeromyxobacter sp.]